MRSRSPSCRLIEVDESAVIAPPNSTLCSVPARAASGAAAGGQVSRIRVEHEPPARRERQATCTRSPTRDSRRATASAAPTAQRIACVLALDRHAASARRRRATPVSRRVLARPRRAERENERS